MLPISIAAHTVPSSTGSNRIWVTRVGPALTSEAGSTPGAVSADQVSPASFERHRPAGRVPAISTLGSAGSTATDQTSCIGEGRWVQRAVRSLPAEHAHVGAGEQPVGSIAMTCERPDARFQIHAGMAVRMDEGLTSIFAEPRRVPGRSGVDMNLAFRLLCHTSPPRQPAETALTVE